MVNFFTSDKSQADKANREIDEKTDRPARKSKSAIQAELKAGRWVAPIILILTMLLSGVLWLIKINR
jgi:hypothetical protein